MGLYLVPLGATLLFLECHQRLAPTEFQEGVALYHLATDASVLIVRVGGVGRDPNLFIVANLVHQMFVVGIDEDKPVLTGTEEIIEFTFSLDDALERAKALQMGTTYVGDEATGRLSRFHQRLDVTRVTGSHLNDCNLVLLRQTEQCLGHTHVVVEVALGVKHIVFLGKHGSDQFLRGGLAIGAGDANHGDVKLTTVLTGQVLEGLEAVIDEDEPILKLCIMHSCVPPVASVLRPSGELCIVNCELCIVYDGIGTTLFQGLQGELVAVERLAFEGEEDTSFRTVTTVCRDAGMLLIKPI